MSLLCKFGIHKWEKWTTIFSEYDKSTYKVDSLLTHCEKCHKLKVKFLEHKITVPIEYVKKKF